MEQDNKDRQIRREEEMLALGTEIYRERLEEMKIHGNYSRANGGQYVEFRFLGWMVNQMKTILDDAAAQKVGTNYHVLGPMWERLRAMPRLDLQTGEPTGKTFNPLRIDQACLIVIKLALAECGKHIVIKGDEKGPRAGARTVYSSMVAEIARSLEVQAKINYVRKHAPKHLDMVLEWSYNEHSGLKFKDTAAKRSFARTAKHFDDKEGAIAQTLAGVYSKQLFIEGEGEALVTKILSVLEETARVQGVGDIFQTTFRKNGSQHLKFLSFTPAGAEFVQKLDAGSEESKPYLLPMLEKPIEHTKDNVGGYKLIPNDRRRLANGELIPSQMRLNFMNRQQEVALKINTKIHDLMLRVKELSGPEQVIGSFKPEPAEDEWIKEIPMEVTHDAESWARDTGKSPSRYPALRAAKDERAESIDNFNNVIKAESEESMTEVTLDVVKRVRNDERFFIPVRPEFRGRINPRHTALSYQGPDHQKALLEFADPVPVDEHTEFWMEMGLTAFAGVDKLTIKQRRQWVEDHKSQIQQAVLEPIGCNWWKGEKQEDGTEIDKPWQFLALAQEYVRLFIDRAQPQTTRARIPYDAVCSGQQLMGGVTRCKRTAYAVCLGPSEHNDPRRDVYTDVLNVMKRLVREMHWEVPIYRIDPTTKESKKVGQVPRSKLRKLERKHAKLVIVSAQYGSKDETRWKKVAQKTDLTEEQSKAVYEQLTKPAMAEVMPGLDNFLDWMNRCVDGVKRSKASQIVFEAPDGFEDETPTQVIQRYPRTIWKQIPTDHVGGGSVKTQRAQLSKGIQSDTPAWKDMKQAAAPNIIHMLDSTMLVRALHDCEFDFTTVHDSIYVRPCAEANIIHERIRHSYKTLFESNTLDRFLELNHLDPEEFAPPYVTDDPYNPEDVLKSCYVVS